MKFIVNRLKPRNPLVGPCTLRHAGPYRCGVTALRQKAERRLQRELRFEPPPDSMNRRVAPVHKRHVLKESPS